MGKDGWMTVQREKQVFDYTRMFAELGRWAWDGTGLAIIGTLFLNESLGICLYRIMYINRISVSGKGRV